MERLCVLLLLLVFSKAAIASGIIYPGQLDHAEGDDCPTRSGRTGTCSRSCGHLASVVEPRKCGIKDSVFLVCCDKALGEYPATITDIAPPTITFQCGINTKTPLFSGGYSRGDILRPEPATPPTIIIEVDAVRPARSIPDGVLLEGQEFPEAGGGIGGINSGKDAWPWMALIGERYAEGIRWFCGGVLINDQWVLTAHHCFLYKTADVVRLGEHNYNDDNDGAKHQDFGVTETVFYPDHTFLEAYHDLALLKLDSRVTIQDVISPVCLPWGPESDKDITGQKATLTGWGDTEFVGFPSSILQEVNVTVFPSAQCNRSYSTLPRYADTWPKGIGQETLCAGDPNEGRDPCQGNSGGPLVSQDSHGRFVLAGIVSQGYGCGYKDYPGLYVNVRHPPYLDWIKKVAFATP